MYLSINANLRLFAPIILIFIMFGLVDCSEMDKNDVLARAKKEAIKLGYNPELMELRMSEKALVWNEFVNEWKFFREGKKSSMNPIKKKLLYKKKFWVVYYYPKSSINQIVVGGDLWLFIDEASGKIITQILGK